MGVNWDGPNHPGCKPVDPAATSMMSVAEQEIVALLRKMVANQREIIELLKDISIGLA